MPVQVCESVWSKVCCKRPESNRGFIHMSLSDFIESNLPALVDDWMEYARTLSLEDGHLTPEQLRNSAREILALIATDMREPQTAAQQKAKSRGEQHNPESSFDHIAHQHADDRLVQGYGIND